MLEILHISLTCDDAIRAFEADRFKFFESERDPIPMCANKHVRVTYVSYPRTLRLVVARDFDIVLIDRCINPHLAPELIHRAEKLLHERGGMYHYV